MNGAPLSPHRTLWDHFEITCQAAQKIASCVSRDRNGVCVVSLPSEEAWSGRRRVERPFWQLGLWPLKTAPTWKLLAGEDLEGRSGHCVLQAQRNWPKTHQAWLSLSTFQYKSPAVGLSHHTTLRDHNLRSACSEATSSAPAPRGCELRDRHSSLEPHNTPPNTPYLLSNPHTKDFWPGWRETKRNFFLNLLSKQLSLKKINKSHKQHILQE